MAILDAKLEFLDAYDLSTSVVSTVIYAGNVIDLYAFPGGTGAAQKDGWGSALKESLGEGGSIFLNVNVNTITSAHVLKIQLVTDSALAASNVLSAATIIAEVDLHATSPAGTRRSFSVPSGDLMRYIGIGLISAHASAQTGKIDVWLSNKPADTQITATVLADQLK